MSSRMSRRRFLQAAAVGAGYFYTASARSAARAGAGPNGKVYVGGIGVGGKGGSDVPQAARFAEVVALCDVDENNLAGMARAFPDARRFFDFRTMLDEMGKDIDAA